MDARAADTTQHDEWRAVRPYVAMLICSGLIAAALFVGKLLTHTPSLTYLHFLVTYDFGIIKRALVGEIVSLFQSKVGIIDVYVFGLTAWLIALATYLVVFRRTFTLSRQSLPLLALILGSPFVFKNFMFTIGYFDILGFLVALLALLLPVNRVLPILMGVLSCVLLFIHHLHFLLYIPTIGFIVIVRALATEQLNLRWYVAAGVIATAAIGGAFYFLAFHGSVTVPVDTFVAALRARAASDPNFITADFVRIFYTGIAKEIELTMHNLPSNAMRFPIYAALIYLHLPLIVYFKRVILALSRPLDRLLVLAGLTGITVGYVIIYAVVFDYSRWLGDWGSCMILAMHAVLTLPSSNPAALPIDPEDRRNRWFGWLLTAVPRVGITKPF
jgi:hypothetical protein